MATLSCDDDRLRLDLTSLEKVVGFHGDIEVPLSEVRDLHLETDPMVAVRGLRAPGLGIPGWITIGTRRGRGHRSFVAARRGVPAVRVRLAGGKYDELLVSTPEAERIAADLRARLTA